MSILRAFTGGLKGMKQGYQSPCPERTEEMKARSNHKALRPIAGILAAFLAIGVVAVAGLALFAPQVFHVASVQPPIVLSVRKGVLTPYVLRVKNDSDRYLSGVAIKCTNSRRAQSASHTLEPLDPREVRELGGLEWGWPVGGGDAYTITCDGYFPIVFTASQLGLK